MHLSNFLKVHFSIVLAVMSGSSHGLVLADKDCVFISSYSCECYIPCSSHYLIFMELTPILQQHK